MRGIHLKINKGKMIQLLWDREYRTSAHAARFFTVPAERAATNRLEWFLVWKSPVGEFEARIHWASPQRPMLWVKRQGVIVRAEVLTVSTLMQYKMIGGNENV